MKQSDGSRTPRRPFRAAMTLAAAGCAVVLGGCVILGDKIDQSIWHLNTLPFYVFDNAPVYHEPPQPVALPEPVNFCVAISGGGSRAAVFAAAVMEEINRMPDPRHPGQSVLVDCHAVSAVSGGSLAAVYYGLYKPDRLGDPAADAAFFQRFKSNMGVNFDVRTAVHYLSHPWEAGLKYYTRYRVAQTLANTMDQYLFKGATFDKLSAREACGQAPVTLVNASNLDSGRKFIFSTMNVSKNMNPQAAALDACLGRVASKREAPGMRLLGGIFASPAMGCDGFDSIGSDIGALRVATAVSASSAYPGVPGPAALINYSTNGYVHLGDGGINDSFGIDSLMGYYFRTVQDSPKPRRLVILSINATGPMTPDKEKDPDGYTTTIGYGLRASGVLVTRAETYARALYGTVDSVTVVPVNLAEAACVDARFAAKLATYSVTQDDMGIVVKAAGLLMTGEPGRKLTAALSNGRR